MYKYFSLVRVLFKMAAASFDIHIGKKESKWVKPVFWGFVGVCLIPLLFLFYGMFHGVFALFAAAGQLGYAVGLLLNMGSVMLFVHAAFSAPSVFYMSADITYLLPMPLTARQIIAAKFTVALLFEYTIALVIFLPMLAALYSFVAPVWLTVNAVLVFLVLPVVPLAYAVTMVMLLMGFSKSARNKDRYNMFVGLMTVALGITVGLYSQRMAAIDPEQLKALADNSPVALTALRSLFPHNAFMGVALAGEGLGGLWLGLGITAAVFAAFLALAQVLYPKGAAYITEGAPAKPFTQEGLAEAVRVRGVFAACFIKECRLLFRSPTAILNCVLMVYLMPVMMSVGLYMGLSDTSVALSEFVTQIDFNNRMLNTWLLVGVTAAGFFVSCMCMVTSTAISREGSQYFTMKYLPAPYRTQLNAKAACGILVSCSSLVVLAVFLQVVFRAPLLLFAGGLALVFPGAVFMAYLGLLIDLIKPKLKWENEQQAVKQNFNSLFLLMAGCGISLFLVIFGMVLFAFAPPHTAFVCLLASSGTMAAGMYFIVLHVGGRIMHRL